MLFRSESRSSRAEPPLDERRGTSPWTWLAGFAGLAILAVVAFVAFRFLTGLSGPQSGAVPVPNLVGRTLEDARATVEGLGLKLETTPVPTAEQPIGTILSQDPPPDSTVDRGATISVEVATGTETVTVPDLRGRSEADALAALFAAGLVNGNRTEVYDPIVPVGLIVSQGTATGVQVSKGTPIDYTISMGPEPSPSPSEIGRAHV